MPKVTSIPNPEFGSYTYLVSDLISGESVIIDPGDADLTLLCAAINNARVQRVRYVLLTHEHFDHIAGADQVRAEYAAKVVCSAPCAKALANPKINMSFYHGKPVRLGPPDWVCEEHGWTVPWNGSSIWLVPTPGHSPGGLCAAIGGALFTGDTLLGNLKTPAHLPGGDRGLLKDSIARLVRDFAPETAVYPGHGSSFSLSEIDPQIVLGACDAAG